MALALRGKAGWTPIFPTGSSHCREFPGTNLSPVILHVLHFASPLLFPLSSFRPRPTRRFLGPLFQCVPLYAPELPVPGNKFLVSEKSINDHDPCTHLVYVVNYVLISSITISTHIKIQALTINYPRYYIRTAGSVSCRHNCFQ